MQAQAVGQGRVDVHRLLGNDRLLLGLLELQRAHVVQAVGQLDQDDADVVGHGENHLADVLGLGLFLGFEGDEADFGDAVDDVGHFLAEELFQLVHGGLGVLHGVVEQARGDAGRVQAHVRQDAGRFQRVRQIGLAGQAHLSGVGRGGEHVGLGEQRLFLFGQVDGCLVQDFVDADHGRPGLVHRGVGSVSRCVGTVAGTIFPAETSACPGAPTTW
ncbi:hypothetical protein DSECCO2_656140 [anaerobic digester metagenome]